MHGYPHFTSKLDAARFLIRENRLHELWWDDLAAPEREVLFQDLRAKQSRVRRRARRAHLIGMALTACFLALGVALMTIGPAELLGAFDRWLRMPTLKGQGVRWAILVLLAVLGGASADYVLRRRLKIARMWDHESGAIGDAIRHGEARPPSPAG